MRYLWSLLLISLFSCNVVMDKRVDGNGSSRKEIRKATGFSKVSVGGSFEVTVQQGDVYKVELEADGNLMEYIETNVADGELEINEKDGYNIRSKNPIKVWIQLPKTDGLSMAGSGSIKSEGALENGKKIELRIGGSGEMELQVKSPMIDLEIGGSGKATLSGNTKDLDVSIGGSGDCFAEELLSENCKASIGGSGTARVYASVNLNVSVGGSGDVYYAGNPSVSKSIGGSGTVEAIK